MFRATYNVEVSKVYAKIKTKTLQQQNLMQTKVKRLDHIIAIPI